MAGERTHLGSVDRPAYLSFAQYDARQFGSAITRGMIETYADPVESVYSAGAASAELEQALAAATDWTVRAIDLDEGVVRAARSRSLPDNLTVEAGDVCEPPDREHDVAIAFGSVQELVGCLVEGLRGLRDALRPGGVALVAVPNLANMLRVLRPDCLRVDGAPDGGWQLAAADVGLPDGSDLTQYGFTYEGQQFSDADDLDFDPETLTPFEDLAERAGLRPASVGPLAEWADGVELRSVDGERIDEFDLAVGERFPVRVPVDPGGLVGETGPPIHHAVDSFDREAADELASAVEQRGLERHRLAQARDGALPPRADLFVFRRLD